MNLVKLLCAPVVMAVAVVEDAVTILPRRSMGDDGPTAVERALKALSEPTR